MTKKTPIKVTAPFKITMDWEKMWCIQVRLGEDLIAQFYGKSKVKVKENAKPYRLYAFGELVIR